MDNSTDQPTVHPGQALQMTVPGVAVEQPPAKTSSFLKGAFSDDGQPSSSRVVTGALALAVIGIVIGIFHHVCRITDTTTLSIWLGNLPIIIASLIGLMTAPYTINRGTVTLTQIFDSLSKK